MIETICFNPLLVLHAIKFSIPTAVTVVKFPPFRVQFSNLRVSTWSHVRTINESLKSYPRLLFSDQGTIAENCLLSSAVPS